MNDRVGKTVATCNPLSAVVLIESLEGEAVGAGLLLTWGGGRAAQVALCAASGALRETERLKIALPAINGPDWTEAHLADVSAGNVVETASSISVLRMKLDAFRGRAWAFGRLARSPMVSVEGLVVGTSAFLPALIDGPGRRVSGPLLLERSFAGRDGDVLLVNAPSASCLPGTPVFVRRPAWPRVSGVGLLLGGFLVEGTDGRLDVSRMAHVSALVGDELRWKNAPTDKTSAEGHARLEGLSPMIEAFLVASSATGRFSDATLKARRYDLSMLDRWAREAGLDPADLNEEQLSRYFRLREDEGLSSLTLLRARSSADRFYAYLVERGARGDAPVAQLARTEAQLRPKVMLDESEARRLLGQPDKSTAIGRRDRALLEVLYATAIKPHELVSLTIEDIDLHGGTIRLQGRRFGATVLPLNAPARSALKAHLREIARGDSPSTTGPVFCTAKRKPIPYTRVGEIVRRHAVAAGLPEHVTGSTLRNSAANHLLRRGVDRKVLAAFLGVRDGNDLEAYGPVERRTQSRA